MAEYMSREDYCEITCGKENREGYKTCHNCSMLNVPSTDVQPFKWVRCEESLPVYDGLVLVTDRDNNIRLGIFTETGWLSQFGNPMMPRPKAWAKIPELPEPIKG